MPMFWWCVCQLLMILFLSHVVRPQDETVATTHPDEARALNSVFAAWRILAPRGWNTSGELCSNAAINDTISIDNNAYNPLIKCDCSFTNNTICHITALKVYAKDVIGPIPEELWTLKYLTNLNLGQNVLTGSLSPAIGNLTRMQWMTFGINALSGPVPKEIGLLTDLRSLRLNSNNFSGSIPAEIGNCIELQQIYIGSSGLSGEIPLSFANLVLLELAWMEDLEVTGRIPDFIGNWTKLYSLRIFGTGMSGPIPSSFSNLTSLTELMLGDISNGSSSLEFIKDMKSLRILMLRNSNLTGTIPSNIGEYSTLEQVDLSFNKLHGAIPASLFNLRRLNHVFLGNNLLNGSLPPQKWHSLNNIDVSYNDLSGSLPSWSLSNLKFNLVGNRFTFEGLDNRVLLGLHCLQKNFPCNRGKGIYSDFSINCGGPEKRSITGAVFEREDGDLGPASFVVSAAQRWAASSVGFFIQGLSNIYTATSKVHFVNTLDSELFQSARLSASSLRYYGLGLENGGYTVKLQFADIQFIGFTSNTWRGIGRRRFDIYVQLLNMDVKPSTFTYSELRSATQDFDLSNKLGEGGFGPVYKGSLNDGRDVAVKLLSVGSRQGKGQFVAEIVAISVVQHRNLVKLYGCCYEGDHRLLVYEYLPNGSLDQALFGDKTLHLDWPTRYKICMGVARGLVYLHEEARVRIVHRDVKASNILLDTKLVPKVSDFGLAKLYDDTKTHISTRVAGTIGYLAPEYAMRGHLTEKTDVYAFGVVALELVSGRKNSDENLEEEKRYLLEWAWTLHEKSRDVELIDDELSEYNIEEVKRMIGIALLCTQSSHAIRPPMSRVVAMLSGDVEVSDVTSKPGYLTDCRFDETARSSFSGFQTNNTSFSTSFVTPGPNMSPSDSDSKPMLGFKINEGR